MTNKRSQLKRSNEQEALNTIEEMEYAALRRALTPPWFAVAIAVLAGALVTLSAAGLREYQVLVIMMLAIVIGYQAQKAEVSARIFPSKLVGVTVIVGMIVIYFLLVIAAQILQERFGFSWAPLATGAVLAVAILVLIASDRRRYDNKVNGEGLA
jgi:FtsH-binding integral membrane protein